MEPSYEVVMDLSDMGWLVLAYGIHGLMATAQLGLAVFLVVSGVRRLRELDPVPAARGLGVARLAFGVLLMLPLLVGAPWITSFAAAVGALALTVASERNREIGPGFISRVTRPLAVTCAALTAAFIVWEREDGLSLGIELVRTMGEIRNEELQWQLAADRKAPKVGEAAPDFELQDPEGVAHVRLSDFRGKRPVALVFGSYT